jgi:hypothetical protein
MACECPAPGVKSLPRILTRFEPDFSSMLNLRNHKAERLRVKARAEL